LLLILLNQHSLTIKLFFISCLWHYILVQFLKFIDLGGYLKLFMLTKEGKFKKLLELIKEFELAVNLSKESKKERKKLLIAQIEAIFKEMA
jgi:hypothetical protein